MRLDVRLITLLSFALLIDTGCASFSSLQTASSVPEGETRTTAAVSYARGFGRQVPMLEGGVRRGLSEGKEIGVRLWTAGLAGELKTEILETSRSTLSVAAQLGFGFHPDTLESSACSRLLFPCERFNDWYFHLQAGVTALYGIRFEGDELVLSARVGDAYAPSLQEGGTNSLLAGGSIGYAFSIGGGARIMPEVSFALPMHAGEISHRGPVAAEVSLGIMADR